jgi:hypothetical protein
MRDLKSPYEIFQTSHFLHSKVASISLSHQQYQFLSPFLISQGHIKDICSNSIAMCKLSFQPLNVTKVGQTKGIYTMQHKGMLNLEDSLGVMYMS